MATPVLLAWSGGKDSTMALERLLADARWSVKALLTTVTAGYERISIHGVRRDVLQRQVAGLGLPLIEAAIPPQSSNETYEAAFATALEQAQQRWQGLEHIAFGDLFLSDVRQYREQLLQRLEWKGAYPLWGEDTARLSRYFVDRGYRAVLSCVDTQLLAADFCGCDYDHAMLDALPAGVDPCGEYGEFHTCVYGGPLWREPLVLQRGEQLLREQRFQYCDLLL